MTKQFIASSLIASSLVFFTGCAAVTGHSGSLKKFNDDLSSGKCDYKFFDEKIKDKNDVILWGIQGGSMARNCLNYNKSNALFDDAELNYKEEVDKDGIAGNIGEGTKSVLVNNNVNEYEGNVYEKVMLNTYKGLNFIGLNDFSNARIEFNRALDRQRRAKDHFEKDIAEKAEKNKGKKQDTKAANAVYKKYGDVLNNFKAYPDFVNPFTTYSSGLFFLLDGDTTKARDLFKEAMLMDPKNKQFKSDFELTEKFASSVNNKNSKSYAWVIYENGKGMMQDEMRFDIPLFLVTSKVAYTGIALPQIKERAESFPFLDVNGAKTTMISNMDNVIKTEFKKKFPTIVTEAIMSLTVKTIAQYQVKKNAGFWGGMAMAAYQGLTNKADVRSWTALPKNFHSVRVELNDQPVVIKDNNGKIISSITIPENSNALIYIKSESKENVKVHKTIFRKG